MSDIQLSANTALMPGTSLDEVLAFYREIGIRRVELIQFMHGPEVEAAAADELAATLARHGQELIALYCRPIDVWTPDRLEASVAGVVRAVGIAEELGATRVVFPPLLPRQGFDYALLVQACRQVLERTAGSPVRVCLENHHDWPMARPEDYRSVLGEVDDPRLAVALDTGHFTSSGVDGPAFVREFAPRIAHVHLKDHVGTRSVPFGRGETDNVGTVQALREVGFRGYASIELEVEDPENVRGYLRDAVEYCGQVLGIR